MASKRVKTVIFRNGRKIQKGLLKKFSNKFNLRFLGFRWARKLVKKNKLIDIKKSRGWAQSDFCSLNRLEMASKMVETLFITLRLKNWSDLTKDDYV